MINIENLDVDILKFIWNEKVAKSFYDWFPKTITENLEKRIELYKILAYDDKFKQWYMDKCREYLPLMFVSLFWTMNPQKPPGERNQPFIPRPKQVKVILRLDKCIKKGRNFGIPKSRKQGATEIVSKVFSAHCMLYELSNFIVGSRKKELVDDSVDPYTIYAKIDHVFNSLPSCFSEFKPPHGIERKDMSLKVNKTGSTITGETTNESFSAGSRSTGMLLDEFGRVETRIAKSIDGSIKDVCNCIVYSSTHWLGVNHPFNIALEKATTDVETLFWYESTAEETEGLYTSPEPGKIEILDKKYYKDKDLENALYLKRIEEFNPNKERVQFVADGCIGLPKKLRSPWHDYEQYDRLGDERDFKCNVWGDVFGSSDSVFDSSILKKVKEGFIRPPTFTGELLFDCDNEGEIDFAEFEIDHGRNNFEWWGSLINNRPSQNHNYIIGCDISFGTGSSNSAAAIYDVNTEELIGLWTDPNTPPEEFADLVIAMTEWLGGVDEPFLIWESNGGQGDMFTARIKEHGYYNVYYQTREDVKTRKRTDKYGFRSQNQDVKAALLGNLNSALAEGLKENSIYKSIKIYSKDLHDEMLDYMFTDGGQITTSRTADLSTGARERHGDRTVAAALCLWALADTEKGYRENVKEPPFNSFEYHKRILEVKQEQEKHEKKIYLY